ncbi:hypothetical protein [Amycolatopsis anabasis]|uniref:hypothetical protein n=1 Tax=Amycolatopsis anabasis TaxID=1840409 RepID=UPI00131B94A7|nr:hypothetical protein [Amycolatopsis anabasis]
MRTQVPYSPEQYERAVDLWRRLIDNYRTSLTCDRYGRGIDRLPDETLYALILSDGEETEDEYAVTLTLASYSDYGGSCCDAANVRVFRDEFGWVSTSTDGYHGDGAAWVQFGELPDTQDIGNGLDMLESLANAMDRLTDYPLLSDEAHSEYEHELQEEAWVSWLEWDVKSELDDQMGGYLEIFGFTDNEIRELYYSYEENEWECESATSVVNRNHDDAVAYVLDEIVKAWRTPAVGPNQLALND